MRITDNFGCAGRVLFWLILVAASLVAAAEPALVAAVYKVNLALGVALDVGFADNVASQRQ
jgi:hypothetical protein